MSTRTASSVLSGLCIIGGVSLALLERDPAQVSTLFGLAGTLALRGRGKDA